MVQVQVPDPREDLESRYFLDPPGGLGLGRGACSFVDQQPNVRVDSADHVHLSGIPLQRTRTQGRDHRGSSFWIASVVHRSICWLSMLDRKYRGSELSLLKPCRKAETADT